MTPAGIESATFRFVAQHLNHCVGFVMCVCVCVCVCVVCGFCNVWVFVYVGFVTCGCVYVWVV